MEIERAHRRAEMPPARWPTQQHGPADQNENQPDARAQQEQSAFSIFGQEHEHRRDAASHRYELQSRGVATENSRMIKRAVLLAAGRGTRMRELTDDLPKPMLPVLGKPVLQHIVEGLRLAGVREFLIIVGWRAEIVRAHFGAGEQFGAEINYETQVVQDGTGRVVELARPFAGDQPFILSYGDILVESANYAHLAALSAETEATVSVKRNEDVSKGGAVFVNERFELIDLREKPLPGEPTSPWYNAGVYAFRPSIFEFTARLERSPRGEFELTDAIRELAQSGRKVQAFELSGAWADVRDPEILASLNQATGAPR